MFALDPLYWLLILPVILGWVAQARVRRVYAQYGAIPNSHGLRGMDVAATLLDAIELGSVRVEQTPGTLTDHYDPQANVLRLSEGVAGSASVMSLGVVAHEVGHAAQDAEGFHALNVRTRLAAILEQLARVSPFVFIGGMLFGNLGLMVLGGLMLAGQAVFALVTLPVERNASVRAEQMLDRTGLASLEERRSVRTVLRAAAMTYLASLGQRLATLVFFAFVILAARGTPPGG